MHSHNRLCRRVSHPHRQCNVFVVVKHILHTSSWPCDLFLILIARGVPSNRKIEYENSTLLSKITLGLQSFCGRKGSGVKRFQLYNVWLHPCSCQILCCTDSELNALQQNLARGGQSLTKLDQDITTLGQSLGLNLSKEHKNSNGQSLIWPRGVRPLWTVLRFRLYICDVLRLWDWGWHFGDFTPTNAQMCIPRRRKACSSSNILKANELWRW